MRPGAIAGVAIHALGNNQASGNLSGNTRKRGQIPFPGESAEKGI
jgi:hypothetical protein